MFKSIIRMLAVWICSGMIVTSCSKDDGMVPPSPEQTPTLIIYDTDIGSSTDDLFGLEMLHRYHDEGRCRLLGVVSDREGEEYAACTDMMNTYFGHGFLPVGMVRNGVKNPPVWIDYKELPNYADGNGKLMFSRSITDYTTLPDGWELYRRLLSAQPDHSVSICSVGFVTALAQLLATEPDQYSPLNGVDLVRQKVKCIYLMGGVFHNSVEPDFNFRKSFAFAREFFRLWPKEVDMVFSPMEVGENVEYKPEQVISDVSWTDVHPIKQVYMRCNCNTGQMMWDPMSVIQAVEGDELFLLSERGTVEFREDAMTVFTPSATGNCRYQKAKNTTWNQAMLEKIRWYNMMH